MISWTLLETHTETAKALIQQGITSEDKAEAESRTHETARHNFLLARAALRILLAKTTYQKNASITRDEKGKPHITGGPHISISHTEGLVACVVSTQSPIGIDVEHWRPRDYAALASYVYGPREQADVAREGAAAFYRIWTLKEAMVKAEGKGIFTTMTGQDAFKQYDDKDIWQDDEWQFFYKIPKPSYSLAIASKDKTLWTAESLQQVTLSSP